MYRTPATPRRTGLTKCRWSANEFDFATQAAQGHGRRSRRRSIFHARHGGCAAAGSGHARADRGGEGSKVIDYTSTDLPVAEKLAKAFEAKYPGIAVRVERTGAERLFQLSGRNIPARRRYREFIRRRAFHRLEA
ncbi:hypothetical protein [Bradyrhizobium sp. sGM-13]|uniref:hypothetical protein n=1 Tax=Bradyrhizobium sp. sGM-13 TaxID=2831781 RepID=UPI0028112561|nr:hypothetical protein [Bradyrhizobium sp. sGM-13]